MDPRHVAFVKAALADELEDAGVSLPGDRLDRLADVASKTAITWVIGAAQEGMIDSVHVSSEDPRDAGQ